MRVSSSHITNLVDIVNATLTEVGSPIRYEVDIFNTPTMVRVRAEGGTHYFSQVMTLREGYEALVLVYSTLHNLNLKGSK